MAENNKGFSKDTLYLEKNLAWVLTEPCVILGLTLSAETQRIMEYTKKISAVRKRLDSSPWRRLTIISKIHLIKSPTVLTLVQQRHFLLQMTFFEELEKKLSCSVFILRWESDKIAKKTIIDDRHERMGYKDGLFLMVC